MSKQYGTVLVFKPELTEEQINAFLATIAKVIDETYYVADGPKAVAFDRDYGGPVWYVP